MQILIVMLLIVIIVLLWLIYLTTDGFNEDLKQLRILVSQIERKQGQSDNDNT